jgi:hypothetical protein
MVPLIAAPLRSFTVSAEAVAARMRANAVAVRVMRIGMGPREE